MARKKIRSGSPAGEPDYLAVGFLRRAHGVAGELQMDLHTDFPESLQPGRVLYLGESHEPVTVTSCRPHGGARLIKFAGIDNPEAAARYRNTWAFVRASQASRLPPGRLYKHEMIGMEVIADDQRPLGKITEIIETGANDVYVVRMPSGSEVLLPAIPTVILEIRSDSRTVRVHLIDGLVNSSPAGPPRD